MKVKVLIILLLSAKIFAKENFQHIDSKTIDSLDYQSSQTYHKYTVEFFQNISKEVKLEKEKRYTLLDLLSIDAIAADGMCFYAGYESTLQGNICKTPNISNSSCNGDKPFACSPILFGDNACVKPSTTNDLVADCSKASSDKFNQAFENIKKNPDDYKKLIDKISTYCKENKVAQKSCSIYDSRLKKLKDAMEKEDRKQKESAQTTAKDIQKAHGILEDCKKSYDIENEGFFNAKSNRNILGEVGDSLSCHSNNSNLDVTHFEVLEESLKDIEKHFNLNAQKDLLKQVNSKSLELSMDAILATQVAQNGQIDEKIKDQILKKFPSIKNDDSLNIAIENKIQSFKNNKQKIKEALFTPPEKTLESFNSLSKKINELCTNIRKDERNSNNTKKFALGNLISFDTYVDSDQDKALYSEYQTKMRNIFNDFQKNSKQANLFSTETMRDDYGTYTEDLAEKCAENDIEKPFKKDLNKNLLSKAQKEMQQTLLRGLDPIEASAKALSNRNTHRSKGLVENQIEHILKYQPYLIGGVLNDPNFKNKEVLAKYICKQSFDIYNSDEWFKVADYGIAATTLVAAIAVNVIPGVGQAASVALFASLGATNATLAGAKIVESNRTINSSENAIATGQVQLTQATNKIDQAETDRKWAAAEIVTEGVGIGLLAKGTKAAKAAIKGADTASSAVSTTKKSNDILLTAEQAAKQLGETSRSSAAMKAARQRARDLMKATAKELDEISPQIAQKADELGKIKEAAIEATKKVDEAADNIKKAEEALKVAQKAKPKLQAPIDDAKKALTEAKDSLKVAQSEAKMAQQASKASLAKGTDEMAEIAGTGVQKAQKFLTEALDKQARLADEIEIATRSLNQAKEHGEKAIAAQKKLDELQKKRKILNEMMDDAQVADSGKNFIDDMAEISKLTDEVADLTSKANAAKPEIKIFEKLLNQHDQALRLAKQDTASAKKLLEQATKAADETSEAIIRLTGIPPVELNKTQKIATVILGSSTPKQRATDETYENDIAEEIIEDSSATNNDAETEGNTENDSSTGPEEKPTPDAVIATDLADLIKFNAESDECEVNVKVTLKAAKEKYPDLSCRFINCSEEKYKDDPKKCDRYELEKGDNVFKRNDKGFYLYPICKTSKDSDKYEYVKLADGKGNKKVLISSHDEMVSCSKENEKQMPNFVIPDAAPNVGQPQMIPAPSSPILIEY